tara:strand:- start:459 stop:899 length:441 start_codon:yes stop_codon:yes gene_type:complete
MNIPYYEMQRKNVHMIDTNSDLSEQELINKLYASNLIGRFPVKGKYSVYWVKCSRNDSRIYSSKDIQLEVSGNKIFLGANADLGVWQLAKEMMAIFYKEFPFSNLREVRNYICGDIDWSNEEKAAREKIFHARQIRKNPKYYGAEV